MPSTAPKSARPANPKIINALSLGAGVQSSALLLMSAHGLLPKIDYAAFADTGWERPETYEALDRLENEVARPAGIEIVRLSAGDIRRDALDPDSHFATMPLFIQNRDGSKGMLRRQCTSTYKVKVLLAEARRRLGAEVLPDGRVARTKRGVHLNMWVGISTDEFARAKDSGVAYAVNTFPLLQLGLTRADTQAYLDKHGFSAVSKSACIGCPYTSNKGWRSLRDEHPEQWAEAVEFDRSIRAGSARATANGIPLRGQAYLHPSLLPLDEAPIDQRPAPRWRHLRLVETGPRAADPETWEGDPDGCSPWSCRSGRSADDTATAFPEAAA